MAIRGDRPRVVVNTVGPFMTSAAPLLEACQAIGSSYVDLANDVAAVLSLLGQHEAAVAAGCTFVTGSGSGFGVVATELAGTIVEGLPDLEGGRRYQGLRYLAGRLAPGPVGDEPQRLTTPDGDQVVTSTMPLGDLVAAHRARRSSPRGLAAARRSPGGHHRTDGRGNRPAVGRHRTARRLHPGRAVRPVLAESCGGTYLIDRIAPSS